MTTTFTFEGTMITQDCGKCAGIFAITKDYYDQCVRDHNQVWYCPYCQQGWHKSGKSDEQKQRERADRAEQRLRDEKVLHRATERSLIATKGVVTRTKNRVGKGVCPCCNQHFANLHKHMNTKHPEYAADES